MSSAPTPRTTPTLVAGIVDVQVGFDVSPFIYSANSIVTSVCSNSGYTDGFVNSQMELIERWLSAHFYTIFDNQLSMAKAGTANVGFQFKVDLGFNCSMYGQQAMRVDTAGNLAAMNNTATIKRVINVSIGWLGKRCGYGWPGGDPFWSDLTVEQ